MTPRPFGWNSIWNALQLFSKASQGLGVCSVCALGTGASLFLILTPLGVGADQFHIRPESFYFMLCLPGLMISRLALTSQWNLRRKLKGLRELKRRGLITERQYTVAAQQIMNWYTAIEYPKEGNNHLPSKVPSNPDSKTAPEKPRSE